MWAIKKITALMVVILMLVTCVFSAVPAVAADTNIMLEGKGIAIEVDKRTSLAVYMIDLNSNKIGLTQPLSSAAVTGSVIINNKIVTDFLLTESRVDTIEDGLLGRGKRLTVIGKSASTGLRRTLVIEISDMSPGTAYVTTKYMAEKANVTTNEIFENRLKVIPVNAPETGSKLWYYNGAATSWGADYILPVKSTTQDINEFSLYGGIPFMDLYSAGGGLGLGSASPVQIDGLKMPVESVSYGTAKMSINWPGKVLKKGVDTLVGTSLLIAHSGDFYNGAKAYGAVMKKLGIAPPASFPKEAFEQQWETYGYFNDFTLDNIYTRLDELKKMGITNVEIDSGWFKDWITGNYELDPKKFPNGAKDMKKLTDAIHQKGMKAILWWMPGDVSKVADVIKQHPEWAAMNKDGTVQNFSGPWGESSSDILLCPSLTEVQKWHSDFTRKCITEWGIDGFKLDSQYTTRACYNPAHKHTDPNEGAADYPLIYKAIYNTAIGLKPEFTINICNCGVNQNFYLFPYQNRVITSDPWDGAARQSRQRVKLLKAFFGDTSPVLADHVERSGEEVSSTDIAYFRDYAASSMGTGSVLETKYTELDAARKAEYTKWFSLGKNLGLTSGEFKGELYNYGFDYPEAYAVNKSGDMYYGFFAEGAYNEKVELRGLDAGKQYYVVDYINGKDYGTVTGPTAKLNVAFEKYLLLKVSTQPQK